MGLIDDVWSWLTTDELGVQTFAGVIAATIIGLALTISRRARVLAGRMATALGRGVRVLADLRLLRVSRVRAGRERAREEGRAEVQAEHDAVRAERLRKPPPPVNWAMRRVTGRREWELLKTGSGTARNVRLESYDDIFNLMGETTWDELPTGNHRMTFFAQVTDVMAFSFGVRVAIHWVDEHDEVRVDTRTVTAPWT